MKLIVSALVLTCTVGLNSVHAQTIEFSQLSVASLGAPLPVAPFGTSYYPILPPYVFHQTLKTWGTGTFTGSVVPSIGFNADDDKGTSPICSGKYPKHLGTDYAAPAGTAVYAIADGTAVRVGTFTSSGDQYVVMESGSSQKWTTLYGHLNTPNVSVGTKIIKGAFLATLFNYRDLGDIPHLHMGIRNGAYTTTSGTSDSTRGFACASDPTYQLNKYKFVSPEVYKYLTPYY
jgi:murein DD-endopeptidase MepM/ murein hydrolase activator NlpD